MVKHNCDICDREIDKEGNINFFEYDFISKDPKTMVKNLKIVISVIVNEINVNCLFCEYCILALLQKINYKLRKKHKNEK